MWRNPMRTDSRELLAVGIFGGKSRGSKSRLGDRIEMLLRRGRTFSPRASALGIIAGTVVLGGLLLAGSLAPRWIAFAQPPRLAFEVTSIKPNSIVIEIVKLGPPAGGRFTATNVSLKMLVMRAWKVKNFEISGGPGWIDSDRYDVAATAAESNIAEYQFKAMLQALIRDRFKFAAHRESREMPIYALLAVGNGSKLPAATGNCVVSLPNSPPPPPPAPGQAEAPIKGASQPPPVLCGGFLMDGSRLEGRKISMAQFTGALSNMLGRSVIDKTGYTGTFDVHLEFMPEGIAPLGGGGFGAPVGPAADAGGADSFRPSFFTAVQQQLGLRLESQKGPVEVLVIDHAEKPDAN
jgi:uncharacterized protein (TIGR03435 family)